MGSRTNILKIIMIILAFIVKKYNNYYILADVKVFKILGWTS
jgi:hypothetical protein